MIHRFFDSSCKSTRSCHHFLPWLVVGPAPAAVHWGGRAAPGIPNTRPGGVERFAQETSRSFPSEYVRIILISLYERVHTCRHSPQTMQTFLSQSSQRQNFFSVFKRLVWIQSNVLSTLLPAGLHASLVAWFLSAEDLKARSLTARTRRLKVRPCWSAGLPEIHFF